MPKVATLIHLGPYKTASTYLQHCWYQLHPQERDANSLVSGPLCMLLHNETWRRWRRSVFLYASTGKPEAYQQAIQLFHESYGALPPHETLLMSDENFCGAPLGSRALRPNWTQPPENPFWRLPRACEVFRELFGEDLHFVFVIRSLPGFLESSYLNLLQNGSRVSFLRFRARVWPSLFRWSQVLEPLAQAVGPERLTVYPYEFLRDAPQDFLTRLSSDFGLPVPQAVPARQNESMSAEAYRRFWSATRGLNREEATQAAQELLRAYPKSEHGAPRLFSQAEKRRLIARSREDSRALFQRYVPQDLHRYFEGAY